MNRELLILLLAVGLWSGFFDSVQTAHGQKEPRSTAPVSGHIQLPGDGDESDLEPGELVRRLIVASHGLRPQSGLEITKLLNQVQREPDLYIPFLVQALHPDRFSGDNTEPSVLKAQNAAMTLNRAGGQLGKTSLTDCLKGLYRASDRMEILLMKNIKHSGGRMSVGNKETLYKERQKIDRLLLVERTIVEEFSKSKDPSLKDLLMERFDREDYGGRLVTIRYFGEVGREDPKIRARLTAIYQDPQSWFFNSAMVKKILSSKDESGDRR